jgi:hypothetical protein
MVLWRSVLPGIPSTPPAATEFPLNPFVPAIPDQVGQSAVPHDRMPSRWSCVIIIADLGLRSPWWRFWPRRDFVWLVVAQIVGGGKKDRSLGAGGAEALRQGMGMASG